MLNLSPFAYSVLGFALGIEVKILFAFFQGKKIGTDSPPERPNTISGELISTKASCEFDQA